MRLLDSRLHNRIVEKKKKLDQLRPLPKNLVKRLKEHITVQFTYDSNAIEGNTLSLHETRLVINEGITIGGKSLTEILEAKNQPNAINFIERLVTSKEEIDEEKILQTNKLILENIREDAGKYRTTSVMIGGAIFTPPPSSEIKSKMLDLIEWITKNPDEYTPVELAATFHHRFVYIHPFIEGNGRTARLLMNAILMKNGYPFITIIPNQDRSKYLQGLMDADRGNEKKFVNFIGQCAERSLDIYLNAIEEPKEFTLKEASKLTSYSQDYLSLLSRKGKLGAYKKGRNWVITKKELNRYLKSVGKKPISTEIT